MKRLVIFGTGDFARVAWFYFSNDSDYRVEAFTVDREFLSERSFEELPVVPFENVESLYPPSQYELFVAVGFKKLNRSRAEIYEKAQLKGYRLASYISSRAVNSGRVVCGQNCFILENNVLQPFVRIGSDVVLWSGSHIGHDAVIGDHCFISSHVILSGRVRIGDRCFLGVNVSVKHGVTIAPECLIGAGAVVLKDTARGGVYLIRSTPATPVDSSHVEMFL
jgi:sugar O-acyltransferase (sialic acid O-acetyltransferase NeuD family)